MQVKKSLDATLSEIIPQDVIKKAQDVANEMYVGAMTSLEKDDKTNLIRLLQNVAAAFKAVDWKHVPPACHKVTVMELSRDDVDIRNLRREDHQQPMVSKLQGFAFLVAKTLTVLGYSVGLSLDGNNACVLYCTVVDADFASKCL